MHSLLMGGLAAVVAVLAPAGRVEAADKKPKIAYVTNGVDPFWNVAAAGVKQAAAEFDVDAEVLMPTKGIADQKRMVETLLVRGVDGIAISPIDAANQVGFINQAAAQTRVVTHDSDAPASKRLAFIGMNNYLAGRTCGKLVKEAIPAGGKVMIFVGRLEQLNAQQRRQGVIDELLDRPEQALSSIRYDSPGKEVAGSKYVILGTRTDNFDRAKAKSNAEDAIAAHGDLACMVGLFAYNPPACLEALKTAGKLGKIQVAAFDEADGTLAAVAAGHAVGTVSQQPNLYGYHSVRILAALARGDKTVLPKEGFLEVPIVVVRKDNVESFRTQLKKLRGE